MASRPTIYLSNWSSRRRPGHHGPGRKLSGMALPRPWELGDGRCDVVAPDPDLLRRVKAGAMQADDYFRAYQERMAARADRLRHGMLDFVVTGSDRRVLVDDGDSILCACAAPSTSIVGSLLGMEGRNRCHVEFLGPALIRAGWAVVLYGLDLHLGSDPSQG